MRGEVKYKARNLVAIYYGIVDLKDKPDAKTLIRREIESLLDRQAFVYGVRPFPPYLFSIMSHFLLEGPKGSRWVLSEQGDPNHHQQYLVPQPQGGRSRSP